MSATIIELNDGAIKIARSDGIVATSTGFALVAGETLVLGEEAERQARLHPTNSYNKYWHELSMEPLNHDNHIRHTADIAYEQLVHLAELGSVESDVIFAVPSSFSNQQLAILLGLAQQSPLSAVGVVDCAVAAAVAAGVKKSAVYLDFQLHQVVLTKIVSNNGTLKAESVTQIPGVGIQNFVNSLMQQATDLFIEQCRFNPQHNAEYEQLLYNQLPSWLHQYDESQTSLMLELKTSDALHTAKMPKESLIASLQGRYAQVQQELIPLLSHDSTIVLCDRLASLPGFVSSLPKEYAYSVLPENALSEVCLANIGAIAQDSQAIHRVKSLPSPISASTPPIGTQQPMALPTHMLVEHHAIPITGNDLLGKNGGFKLSNGRFFVTSETEYLLNKHPVTGEQPLQLGDQLIVGSDRKTMTAIRVSDGE